MASIATGIDYDTQGQTKSTGKDMRDRQPDKVGGTDSGDAVRAWESYGQKLVVRDGQSFDQALVDLKAGRLVHIDVWHATCGGPCLSGSGGYGHTMAVAPERSGTSWLVADPWCNPPKWTWWPEAKLRAGAEEWGRRVYGRVFARDATGAETAVQEVVRELMEEFYPGHEDPDPEPTDEVVDTGGGQKILFTSATRTGHRLERLTTTPRSPRRRICGTTTRSGGSSTAPTLSRSALGLLSVVPRRTRVARRPGRSSRAVAHSVATTPR